MSVRGARALAVAALLLAASQDASAQGSSLIGQVAPPFRLQDVEGRALSLGDLRGRLVVLHFGASW